MSYKRARPTCTMILHPATRNPWNICGDWPCRGGCKLPGDFVQFHPCMCILYIRYTSIYVRMYACIYCQFRPCCMSHVDQDASFAIATDSRVGGWLSVRASHRKRPSEHHRAGVGKGSGRSGYGGRGSRSFDHLASTIQYPFLLVRVSPIAGCLPTKSKPVWFRYW